MIVVGENEVTDTDRRCNQGSRMEFNASMCRIAKNQGIFCGSRSDGG